ncbi:uncharacterized protein UDID_17816 [Ustilago sp. UG-2017a]|nr:uncharacterized protein UDID_17816 [Ustilago sp. UG-2017a]
MLFIDVLTVSLATLHLVSPGLCVNFFDTAPPPHGLLAGALTQLFFLRPAMVLQVFILWPLSGNQLHAPELGPLLGDTWSCSSQAKADSTADLSELCCKSCNLPDPLIPVLPSYESTGLPASCAFRPMTERRAEYNIQTQGHLPALLDLNPDENICIKGLLEIMRGELEATAMSFPHVNIV